GLPGRRAPDTRREAPRAVPCRGGGDRPRRGGGRQAAPRRADLPLPPARAVDRTGRGRARRACAYARAVRPPGARDPDAPRLDRVRSVVGFCRPPPGRTPPPRPLGS